jgi:hypothetical protein
MCYLICQWKVVRLNSGKWENGLYYVNAKDVCKDVLLSNLEFPQLCIDTLLILLSISAWQVIWFESSMSLKVHRYKAWLPFYSTFERGWKDLRDGAQCRKLSGQKCALQGNSLTQASLSLSFCFLVDIK